MVKKNGIQNAKIFKVMLSSSIFNKINIGGGNHFLITFFYFCASNYGFCHDWTFFDAFFCHTAMTAPFFRTGRYHEYQDNCSSN